MRVRIRKWGNSASVRLPAALLKSTGLALDQEVDVREDDGRLLIEPVRDKKYRLEDLVSDISDDNRHDEVDTGVPVGRETW